LEERRGNGQNDPGWEPNVSPIRNSPGACNVAQSNVLLNTYKSLGLRELSLRHSLSSWPRYDVRNHKKGIDPSLDTPIRLTAKS